MKQKPTTLQGNRIPSGLRAAWKLWRHCCCRNGFYPLIVAPFITASFLLDIFCTIGCGFISLDVGFQPINEAWPKQKLEFGLYSFQSGLNNSNERPFMNVFHPGCAEYDDLFKEFFVNGDKTWIMSQIMGIVSASAGGLATVVVWLMVISPLPSCFIWPGIVLPASLVAFLGTGAKFLFFDIEVCRSNLWLPEGAGALPLAAESCSFGMDAILSMISSTLSLACVLLVCLKAPKRREFDDSSALSYSDVGGDLQNLRTHTMEDSFMEGSGSFDADIEAQKSGSYEKNSAYDLDDISTGADLERGNFNREQNIQKSSQNRNMDLYTTVTLKKSSSDTASIKSSRSSKSSKKSSKVKRNVDLSSEKLRAEEPSIEYTEKQLNEVLYEKTHALPRRPLTPPQKQTITKSSDLHSSPFVNPPNMIRQRSTAFSPSAPSDESGYMFRSPFGKENASPHFTPGSKRSTPKMKKTSSKKSNKKTEKSSNKSQKYDEALIQKCVVDLERSFSESEQLPGQGGNTHYR